MDGLKEVVDLFAYERYHPRPELQDQQGRSSAAAALERVTVRPDADLFGKDVGKPAAFGLNPVLIRFHAVGCGFGY